MRGWVFAIAVLALVAAAGTASAVTVDETVAVGPPSDGVATHYVDVHVESTHAEEVVAALTCSGYDCDGTPLFPDPTVRAEVWREANGCPGLQRTVTDCAGPGTPADERVA